MKKLIILLSAAFFFVSCSQKQSVDVTTNTVFIKEKLHINEQVFTYKKVDIPALKDESEIDKVKQFIKDLYINNIELKDNIDYIRDVIYRFNKEEIKEDARK